jgi:hypothetical protein
MRGHPRQQPLASSVDDDSAENRAARTVEFERNCLWQPLPPGDTSDDSEAKNDVGKANK